jgi:hypothetical protein
VLLRFTPMDATKDPFGSEVFNGITAVPIMAVMTLLATL